MKTPLLDRITQPSDLKKLSDQQLILLCNEIRQFLLENISRTGGHLASNLGMVELTVALHRVLDTPQDKIVFDVGHQCYTHKLLTGRRKYFSQLRQLGGISGFPNPNESEHDAFIAGHGNTSLSVAIGMAWAKKLKGEPGLVVVVIGDGAFTGGMVYEGMNNIGDLDNLIVILNDNKMSISRNVGAVAQYLTRLRTSPKYFQTVRKVSKMVTAVPVVGPPMQQVLSESKTILRRLMYHSTMFEDMGFQYIGPLDGHKVVELEQTLKNVRVRSGPLFLHVITTKGKGYRPAEQNPGNYHGVSAFDPAGLPDPECSPAESYSNVFGQVLSGAAQKNHRICAITAAMTYGTGLQFFKHQHPERFFDVGMAEQHAVTFAAGLASQGMLPVVAIYSTFLQRAYDQILHDVNLMKLNVLFAVDRAGLVPGDGETHQGIYDPAFLSQTGMPIYSPSNYAELRYWLEQLLNSSLKGPRAIRYPRGGESELLASSGCTGKEYDQLVTNPKAKAVIISYSDEVEQMLKACAKLNEQRIECDGYKLVKIFPFTEEFLSEIERYNIVLFTEECIARGGIGELLASMLKQRGWNGQFIHHAVDSTKLTHATVSQLQQLMGLDADHLAQSISQAVLHHAQPTAN